MAQSPVNCVVLLSLFLWISANMCSCVCTQTHYSVHTQDGMHTIKGSLDTPTHSLTSEK